MKAFLKFFLSIFNYSIVKNDYLNPINMLDTSSDIRNIDYFLDSKGVLINARLDKGRGLPINTYGRSGNHPFSIAVKTSQGLERKDQIVKIQSILSEYYQKVSPASLEDIFRFKKRGNLSKFPPWAIVMPWQTECPEEWLNNIASIVAYENRPYNKNIKIDSGWAWTGPTNIKKCKIETIRLVNTARSISSNGYVRNNTSDGDIRADILVNESNDWVWQSCAGQHRAATVSGLGFEEIPVRVRKVIRREEYKFWPNVYNQFYSEEEGLWMFDAIFNGNFGAITESWNSYLNENGFLEN